MIASLRAHHALRLANRLGDEADAVLYDTATTYTDSAYRRAEQQRARQYRLLRFCRALLGGVP